VNTVEVKDADGNVVGSAQVEDSAQLRRLLQQLDRKRGQRSLIVITLRDHIVASRAGGKITCKCGEVSPDAGHWAVHVAHALIPEAT